MKKKSKLDIIIQARIGSSRLKGKVLKNYRKLNLLSILMERLKKCKNVNDIIICTTNLKEDNKMAKFCKKKNIKFFRGKKNDVLSRYYNCTLDLNSNDTITRVTGDNIFPDGKFIKKALEIFYKKKLEKRFDIIFTGSFLRLNLLNLIKGNPYPSNIFSLSISLSE